MFGTIILVNVVMVKQSILTNSIYKFAKAIIGNGFSESYLVKSAERLGFGTYLKKPNIKEKLRVAVRKELDRK